VRDIAKLLQFTMTMSMAKACGALEEKCNTLNEALKKEQEAGQKKIEALEKKQALRIRLENIQGKLASLVTTTSKLEAKEKDINESKKIALDSFIWPIPFKTLNEKLNETLNEKLNKIEMLDEKLDESIIKTLLDILVNEQGTYDTHDRVNVISLH
jgi:hypothetical protein